MASVHPTGKTVWVAVSRYAPEDDIEPIVAVGETKEAAEAALDEAVRCSCSIAADDGGDAQAEREMWVDEVAVELPVHALYLTVS